MAPRMRPSASRIGAAVKASQQPSVPRWGRKILGFEGAIDQLGRSILAVIEGFYSGGRGIDNEVGHDWPFAWGRRRPLTIGSDHRAGRTPVMAAQALFSA